MKPLIFELDVEPFPQSRPRVTKFGTYMPKHCRDNAKAIKQELLKQYQDDPLDCPLHVKIMFYITRPKSVPVKKRKYPTTARFDVDNLVKQVLDSLNNLLWQDDGCIIDVEAKKRYAPMGSDGKIVIQVTKILD